ncbi:hypothetical protein, partial [Pseudomonas ficuserectae]
IPAYNPIYRIFASKSSHGARGTRVVTAGLPEFSDDFWVSIWNTRNLCRQRYNAGLSASGRQQHQCNGLIWSLGGR